MKSNFSNLGPLIEEARTPVVCHVCGSYIFKCIYHDENSKDRKKVVFVCKNCVKNEK